MGTRSDRRKALEAAEPGEFEDAERTLEVTVTMPVYGKQRHVERTAEAVAAEMALQFGRRAVVTHNGQVVQAP